MDRVNKLHGSTLTIPELEEEFSALVNETKYEGFCDKVQIANEDTAIVGRPAMEELWAFICRSKANETFPTEGEGILGGIEGIGSADAMGQKEIVLQDAFEQVGFISTFLSMSFNILS